MISRRLKLIIGLDRIALRAGFTTWLIDVYIRYQKELSHPIALGIWWFGIIGWSVVGGR